MVKIAFLSHYQNTSTRGAEVFVKELSSRLSKDFEVKILSGNDADSLTKILNGNFHIVIPINGWTQALKASVGRLVGRYKVLITGHSGIGRDDIFNLAVANPDVFVVLTNYMAQNIRTVFARKIAFKTKIVKIPNGVDLNRFKPEGERYKFNLRRPIVLSVGALVWYKYHQRTIEALSRLNGVSLVIVGSGEQKDYLEKLGAKKLGERFKLFQAPYQELPKIYRACDLFVLPSWDREAFGIVYLEAMASNLAVVAPNDSPRQEIVGGAGLLVDTANIQEYSQAIKKALNLNWGNMPRQQASKFSWDQTTRRYEKIFKELVKK